MKKNRNLFAGTLFSILMVTVFSGVALAQLGESSFGSKIPLLQGDGILYVLLEIEILRILFKFVYTLYQRSKCILSYISWKVIIEFIFENTSEVIEVGIEP